MVTDEMVELFKTGLEILRVGDKERREDDTPPGRRREFLDIQQTAELDLASAESARGQRV